MVTFRSQSPGTSEETWLGADGWAGVPALVLADVDRLIVVGAHPDDESLGAGGLMARAAALGIEIHLVVATNGDASHPDSPTVTRQELADIRRAELRRAVEQVAPLALVSFLDLPDGELRDHSDVLATHLGSIELTGRTIIASPWRLDGHGDHDVAGEVAARVAVASGAQLLEYPIWMWHWAGPDDPAVPWERFVTLRLDATEQRAKDLAIEAHASQTSALSDRHGDERMLSHEFRDHFSRPFEVFITPSDPESLSQRYFDEFYAKAEDPWGFETRWYERRKRQLTLASLPRPRFDSGLEIGCSIGVLTAELALRCDRLVATDIAERPLARARDRLAGHSHVVVTRLGVPDEWPPGTFDLIVLSEVGYYWSAADLARAIDLIDAALTPAGVVVACHWRHPVDGYPARGDDVHAALRARSGFDVMSEHREEDFLLDVFARHPARSVARDGGLL